MNVMVAFLAFILAGAVGGISHGYFAYGGLKFPHRKSYAIKGSTPEGTPDTVLTMVIPGSLGQAAVGALTGILFFCVYAQPNLTVNFHAAVTTVTFYQLGVAVIAGLGGSKMIADLVDGQQWSKLAPVLQSSDPTKQSPVQGMKASDALQLLGTPAPPTS